MKKIISKKEFLKINNNAASKMQKDESLKNLSLKLISRADQYRWIHQGSWMGEPFLNIAQDIMAIQDIIYTSKPDYIIEVGVGWGGGTLFNASMLKLFGGKKVIGVDIFMPNNLKKRLMNKGEVSKYISLIKGDSLSHQVIKKIKLIIKNSKKVMVILDSSHDHQQVYEELKIYSNFIKKNNYLICCDTFLEKIPKQKHINRPWGIGNNPYTACQKFLTNNKRFIIDFNLQNKLLLTSHPNGYLKATGDLRK